VKPADRFLARRVYSPGAEAILGLLDLDLLAKDLAPGLLTSMLVGLIAWKRTT
jgi:hypothetical protein